MSLDTKYRPIDYDDVLGQQATVTILKELVRQGKGFHQSVLFCGGQGRGKTTLGRIYARALLCHNPQEGQPCNQCPSCKSILNQTSPSFIEVDAATRSGKDDIRKILESLEYKTFSGERLIYLFDESHQLSKDALDALLKPLEDNLPGTEDKKLVCIFCTTEPQKMRTTILSRCAPAFVVHPITPAQIADRLVWVCQQEGINASKDALLAIASYTNGHIRDALKALESSSMLGDVTYDSVAQHLKLDVNVDVLGVLTMLGVGELSEVHGYLQKILARISPGECYLKMVEAAMLGFQSTLGVKPNALYWDAEKIQTLGSEQGVKLLAVAESLSEAVAHPTHHTLLCDVSTLHFRLQGVGLLPIANQFPPTNGNITPKTDPKSTNLVGSSPVFQDRVYLDPRAIRKTSKQEPEKKAFFGALSREAFCKRLGEKVGAWTQETKPHGS